MIFFLISETYSSSSSSSRLKSLDTSTSVYIRINCFEFRQGSQSRSITPVSWSEYTLPSPSLPCLRCIEGSQKWNEKGHTLSNQMKRNEMKSNVNSFFISHASFYMGFRRIPTSQSLLVGLRTWLIEFVSIWLECQLSVDAKIFQDVCRLLKLVASRFLDVLLNFLQPTWEIRAKGAEVRVGRGWKLGGWNHHSADLDRHACGL